MRFQGLRAVGLSALVILAGASSSFAASSAPCKPVVTNRSGGYTTICAELCLCLDAADINALA